MNRRNFLANSAVAVAGLGATAWLRSPRTSAAKSNADDKGMVTIIQFSDSGQNLGPATVKKVYKTDAEWKQQLTALAI